MADGRAEAEDDPGFGLYVHWPFCRSKCPYCDFNSHVRESIDQARWRAALLRELEHAAAGSARRRLTSIFFGGGTPSLMAPETAAAVIERAKALWRLDPEAEITLEANPTSAEAQAFRGFRAAGVDRLSLGVQALEDDALRALGRQHGAAEALAALRLARQVFPRVSFDLIYARPGQDCTAWRAELRRALAEAPGHLSVYQLTIEPGTAFHAAQRRGELVVPDEETAAALFDATQEVLDAAGLPAYEVSNHARPGEASQHNLTYWRYGDYLGVGPGAHGRITRAGRKLATRRHRAPEAWLKLVETRGHGTREEAVLDGELRLAEMVMMGLRLGEGIPRGRFRREFAAAPEAIFDPARIESAAEAGYLELDAQGLRATAAGRRRLDALIPHVLDGAKLSTVRAAEA
ncbi:MAG: radical SAM family heme chaperone HemW [Kiloniellales bacterium]|nr:radical SAM family heme chaperone HemW [Kiloniellales bacterium]